MSRAIDSMLNETIIYGGLPLRRGDVLTLATEHLGKHAAEPFGAQFFAFHLEAVDAEPMTIERAREIMS